MQSLWPLLIFLFAAGASIGSFLNVVIYRLPKGLSLITPRSHCPACKNAVPMVGLIPILGYGFLKGRCRFCQIKISLQYPLVELLCGVMTCALFYFHFLQLKNFSQPEFLIEFALTLWLFYIGCALALIDWQRQRLPNAITHPGVLISFLLATLSPSVGWQQSLFGCGIACVLAAVVIFVFRSLKTTKSLGTGDVKYLLMVSLCLGPKGFVWCGLMAALFATASGLILKKRAVPFGPWIAVGSVLARLLVFR